MPRKKKQQVGAGYAEVLNKLFGTNLKKGEVHAPQRGYDGKWTVGSYIGPGTDIVGRTKRGVKGVSKTDSIANRHDLAYTLAKNADDVRAADIHMLKRIRNAWKNKSDDKLNLAIGAIPIVGKIVGEKIGLLKKGSFSDKTGTTGNATDDELLRNKMNKLTQAGYGRRKKTKKSGAKIKTNAWLTHVANVRKENPDKVYKEILKLASASYKKPKSHGVN